MRVEIWYTILLTLSLMMVLLVINDLGRFSASADSPVEARALALDDSSSDEADDDSSSASTLFHRPHSNVTAALCYKTMFGTVDLRRVAHWARYHYMLGFDHVYMWYLPDLRKNEGFRELSELPFVTLMENNKAYKTDDSPQLKGELDQAAIGNICLNQVAGAFDWVMTADTDEYLRFNETMGLKPFIEKYGANYTYLSFGKHIYTMEFRDKNEPGPFQLSNFPFYVGPFCDARPGCPYEPFESCRGHPVCPIHFGRSKVLVKPKHHPRFMTHGTHIPDPVRGSIQFHTDHAHLMEWPKMYKKKVQNRKEFTVLEQRDRFVNASTGLDIHQWDSKRGYKPNPDGTYTLKYDQGLRPWFNFVNSGKGRDDLYR